MPKKYKTAKEALTAIGATEIKGYELINNFGYIFNLNGKRYDARYWANCYGAALNRWDAMCLGDEKIDPEIKKKILAVLNTCEED